MKEFRQMLFKKVIDYGAQIGRLFDFRGSYPERLGLEPRKIYYCGDSNRAKIVKSMFYKNFQYKYVRAKQRFIYF
jgi:hypothetical protein